jgi:hypothetical protein
MPLSIVIPIHNEEPSILPLYDRLTIVLEKLRKSTTPRPTAASIYSPIWSKPTAA